MKLEAASSGMHHLCRIHGFSAEPAALASIVRTSGSTYRRTGARMVVAADGKVTGALSGGCLEEEVITSARAVIATGKPCLLRFDTRLTLGCDGRVEIFVEPVSGLFSFIARRMVARETCLVTTVFEVIGDDAPPLGSSCLGTDDGNALPWGALEDGRAALAAGRSARHRYAWGECIFDVIHPPIRLVILGVGHDVVPLAKLSASLGWEVRVVAHPGERSPADGLLGVADLLVTSPARLADELRPDAFTAVVVMTHHFGRDLAFLDALLPLPLPYLGLLGPRKRREQMFAALAETSAAFEPAALGKLRSPVGLDLGAETPEEIALSIAAEIRATLSGRTGRPLRECKGPIHANPCAPSERVLQPMTA